MDLGVWIDAYGAAVVLLGSVLEGETVVVLGGLAAHRGYLAFGTVVAAAAAGGFLGDQLWFELGRRIGPRLLARRPRLAARVDELQRRIAGRETPFVLGLRFFVGLRMAGPIALGMTRISYLRFAGLNLLGALAWAPLFAGLGWAFGQTVELLLGDLRRIELGLFAVVAVAGVIAAVLARRRAASAGARSG